ncbi:DUF4238 domain-containing protein [Pseudomonas laurentiana]
MEDVELYDLTTLINKKRQHYVSRFYLESWLSNGRIHALRLKDGKEYPFKALDAANIGYERFFYNLEMDSVVWDALNYIFKEKAATNPFIRNMLQDTFLLKSMDDVLNKGVGVVKDIPEVRENAQEILKYLKRHHLEDSYEKIEAAVAGEIKAFSTCQGDHLQRAPTQETFNHLLIFYCLQLYRTKKKITEVSKFIASLHLEAGGVKVTLSEAQKQAVLKCVLFINSYELALELEKTGCVMRISVNRTDLDFITTDCPAMYFDRPDVLPGFQAFGIMPLSPRLIVNICIPHESGKPGSLLIQNMESLDDVKKTNNIIRKEAYQFVFSSQEIDSGS